MFLYVKVRSAADDVTQPLATEFAPSSNNHE